MNAHPCEVVQSRWSTLPETAKLPQTAGDQVSRETDRQSPYGALSLTAPEIVEGVPLKLLRSDLPLAQLHAISGQRRTSPDWMPEADPEATVKPHRSCRQRTAQNTALRRKVGAGSSDASRGQRSHLEQPGMIFAAKPTCTPFGCPSCKAATTHREHLEQDHDNRIRYATDDGSSSRRLAYLNHSRAWSASSPQLRSSQPWRCPLAHKPHAVQATQSASIGRSLAACHKPPAARRQPPT